MKTKKKPVRVFSFFAYLLFAFSSCLSSYGIQSISSDYGVLIGAAPRQALDILLASEKVSTVVLELEDFSSEQIDLCHKRGIEVFAYMSVGSLEDWRYWYDDFSFLCFKKYDNWEGELWIDVRNRLWQDFIVEVLAKELYNKGADGFFLDNFDVYYQVKMEKDSQKTKAFFLALKDILLRLNGTYGIKCIINGGDEFVTDLISEENSSSLIYAVNQESVFTRIVSYQRNLFASQTKEETAYFTEYLDRVKKSGIKVFLLEYAREEDLVKKTEEVCRSYGYRFFISPSLDLK